MIRVGFHNCPRNGCGREVANTIFCCAPDWFKLSRATRTLIHRTAKMTVLATERRYAFAEAQREWNQ